MATIHSGHIQSVYGWHTSRSVVFTMESFYNDLLHGRTAGAVCAEEITNSLSWPAITIGSNTSQFCLKNECEPYIMFLIAISTCVHLLLVLIRRQCVYDGLSAYWYPDASTVRELCPNGTQVVSETVGMIATQVTLAN